jgi:hypothetical protein
VARGPAAAAALAPPALHARRRAPAARRAPRSSQQEAGGGASYGDQRVYASIGWGAFGVVGGVCIKRWGIETAPFVAFGILSLALAAVGAGMRYNYGGAGAGAAAAAQEAPEAAAAAGSGASSSAGAGADTPAAAPAPAAAAAPGAAPATMAALLRRPDVAIFLFQAAMLGFGMVRRSRCPLCAGQLGSRAADSLQASEQPAAAKAGAQFP